MLLHLRKVFLCLFTCTCTQTWNINVTFLNQTFFSDNRSFRIATNCHLQSLYWYIKSREANLCSTLYARFYSSLSVSSTHRTLECCRRPAPACSWSPADNKLTCVRSSFTVCLCWVLFLSTKYFIKIHLWCKLASTQIYASNWQPHILLTWMQLDRFFSTDLAFHSLHVSSQHHQLKAMLLDALGMRTQQVIKLGFIIETTEIKNIKWDSR